MLEDGIESVTQVDEILKKGVAATKKGQKNEVGLRTAGVSARKEELTQLLRKCTHSANNSCKPTNGSPTSGTRPT